MLNRPSRCPNRPDRSLCRIACAGSNRARLGRRRPGRVPLGDPANRLADRAHHGVDLLGDGLVARQETLAVRRVARRLVDLGHSLLGLGHSPVGELLRLLLQRLAGGTEVLALHGRSPAGRPRSPRRPRARSRRSPAARARGRRRRCRGPGGRRRWRRGGHRRSPRFPRRGDRGPSAGSGRRPRAAPPPPPSRRRRGRRKHRVPYPSPTPRPSRRRTSRPTRHPTRRPTSPPSVSDRDDLLQPVSAEIPRVRARIGRGRRSLQHRRAARRRAMGVRP